MRLGSKDAAWPKTRDQEVYIIATESGYFKVGRSKDFDVRRQELQTGNPEKIVYCGGTMIDPSGVCPVEMERLIHSMLTAYRTTGEWFRAPSLLVYKAWQTAWYRLARPWLYSRESAPVAQGKERRPPKAEVVGSSPAGRAKPKKSVKDRVYEWRGKHPAR